MTRALVVAAALAVAFPRQEKPAAPPQAAAPAAKQGATPLAQQMERIDEAMRFLKRAIRDPEQKDACLTQIALAQQACLSSKALAPKMAARQGDAERPVFLAAYRKGMAALLIEFTKLEVAVLDGDRDAAVASFKKLETMQDEGHSQFTDE
jgi:hypothetical protein